jgi:hypothetical protein
MSAKKTWREELEDDKDLPKVVPVTGRMSRRWGTGTVVIAAPREVDALMRRWLRSEGHPFVRRGAREFVADWERAVFNFSTREPL